MSSVKELAEAIRLAPRTYLCGNGGSAANAQHMANDLVLCGIRAFPLCADMATFSALANDFGYESVFAYQVGVFGDPGDVLIALSGSGNSANIVAALSRGNARGMQTWAILGMSGGAAKHVASRILWIPNSTMQEAEEEQLKIGHELMRILK